MSPITLNMKEVVCLVFEDQGKFLLEQRLDDNLYHGAWTFPGGKVEEVDYKQGSDYLLAASVRESGEEVGLVPEVIEPFTEFEETTRHGNRYRFLGIRVVTFSGDLQNNEPVRRILVWVPEAEVGNHINNVSVDKRIWEDFLNHRRSIP